MQQHKKRRNGKKQKGNIIRKGQRKRNDEITKISTELVVNERQEHNNSNARVTKQWTNTGNYLKTITRNEGAQPSSKRKGTTIKETAMGQMNEQRLRENSNAPQEQKHVQGKAYWAEMRNDRNAKEMQYSTRANRTKREGATQNRTNNDSNSGKHSEQSHTDKTKNIFAKKNR